MTNDTIHQHDRQGGRWVRRAAAVGGLVLGLLTPVAAATEQVVEVTIKDYTFVTKQVPLVPDVPTLIVVKNNDDVRHDFGTSMFQGTTARAESGGVAPYGRQLDGVFLDGGKEVSIRFTMERTGRFEFRCSIHPKMKGEVLLLAVGAV